MIRIVSNSVLPACVVTLSLLTCSLYGQQSQTINANLAAHAEHWGETPQNGIPCMQTYSPRASLVFDVIVPEPGAVYGVSVSLVKVTNGGFLKVFLDDEFQIEVDTYAPANGPETFPVCERFIAPGRHSLKIKSIGQKKSTGGDHLSVAGLEITGPGGSGSWQIESTTFDFTPLTQADAPSLANFVLTELPPRSQEEPFASPADSIPADGVAPDIFSHSLVLVDRIPFRIPRIKDVPETGRLLEEQKPLAIDLPGSAREVFLLLWSKIPAWDNDGGPGKLPIAPIDQSERFTAEIKHDDGTSEHLIPFNATTGRHGLEDGPSLYVLHPRAGGTPKKLIIHDKVNKCSFAVLAATCNTSEAIHPEPRPRETSGWYPYVDRKFPAVTREVQADVQADQAGVSDGIIDAQVDLRNGLRWKHLGSPVYGKVTLDPSALFAVRRNFEWIGSDQWKVVETKALHEGVRDQAPGDGGIVIHLEYKQQKTDLNASVTIVPTEDGTIKMGLKLVNGGDQPFIGRVRFPILEGLELGSLEDTWYYLPESSGASMIHHTEGYVYSSHGSGHPHQVDSFFNPGEWYTLTMLSNDLEGQFHWYDVGKGEEGGWYRLEYLEKRLGPGAVWELPECIVSISPGDWRESFRRYCNWVDSWYTPKPPAQDWYKQSFVTGTWYVYSGLDRMIEGIRKTRDIVGYCDVVGLVGWHGREHPEQPSHQPGFSGHIDEYTGEYGPDALFPVGGKTRFKALIDRAKAAGMPISVYTNPILINEDTHHFGAQRPKWGIGYRPVDYSNMMGYVPCLANQEWLDYFVDSQTFVAQDLGVKVIYLDQAGSGATICNRKDHGHAAPEAHFYGEREITRRIRAAIPDDAVICSEAHPEDTRLQYQNSFYQGAVLRHFTPQIRVPINMTRFAFPDVKCFNNIYGYVLNDNNWERLKFVLFNGDSYFLPRGYDPETWFVPFKESTQVYRKMFRILHENADAFTSSDVQPFIPTLIPGTFVNRFRGDDTVVWTVFNASYRTVKGRLLEIAGKPGVRYIDLWNDTPVTTSTTGGATSLVVEIGPRDVACITKVASNE